MRRLQNFILNCMALAAIVPVGAVFGVLVLFGRFLERIEQRHERLVMRRLRRGPRDGTAKVSRPTREVLNGR